MRLLILAALLFLAWRAVKAWLGQSTVGRRAERDLQAGPVDDIMVKDPACGVYFPKRDGVYVRHQGEDLYFCSTACRDRYLHQAEEDRPPSSD